MSAVSTRSTTQSPANEGQPPGPDGRRPGLAGRAGPDRSSPSTTAAAHWRGPLRSPTRRRSGRRGVIRLMQDLGEVTGDPASPALRPAAADSRRGAASGPRRLLDRGARPRARGPDRPPGPGDRGQQPGPAPAPPGRERRDRPAGGDPEPHDRRLENSFQAMQRFTADASHELRNPLATMRNTIDVLSEQPRTVEEHQAALDSIGEDVDRLRTRSSRTCCSWRGRTTDGWPWSWSRSAWMTWFRPWPRPSQPRGRAGRGPGGRRPGPGPGGRR